MGSFVRRVKTASDATAVQIMHKRGKQVLGIEHIGSAHTAEQLAVLEEAARARLHAGQGELPLGEAAQGLTRGPAELGPTVTSTASLVLWEALAGVYADLGFEATGDGAFRSLVLARTRVGHRPRDGYLLRDDGRRFGHWTRSAVDLGLEGYLDD